MTVAGRKASNPSPTLKMMKHYGFHAVDTPNFTRLRETADIEGITIAELLGRLPADHPALTYSPRPYLVTPKWAKEKLREWGTTSPLWQAKVRGQFPEQAEDALLSLAWLEAAKARAIPSTLRIVYGKIFGS